MRGFALTNVSGTTCVVQGWPGVKLKLRNGQVISPRLRRIHYYSTGVPNHPLRAGAITLRAGGAASFLLFGQDWNYKTNRACARITETLVTPPGAHKGLAIPTGLGLYCAPLNVAPLVQGLRPRFP
jgi:hypothetical protein